MKKTLSLTLNFRMFLVNGHPYSYTFGGPANPGWNAGDYGLVSAAAPVALAREKEADAIWRQGR